MDDIIDDMYQMYVTPCNVTTSDRVEGSGSPPRDGSSGVSDRKDGASSGCYTDLLEMDFDITESIIGGRGVNQNVSIAANSCGLVTQDIVGTMFSNSGVDNTFGGDRDNANHRRANKRKSSQWREPQITEDDIDNEVDIYIGGCVLGLVVKRRIIEEPDITMPIAGSSTASMPTNVQSNGRMNPVAARLPGSNLKSSPLLGPAIFRLAPPSYPLHTSGPVRSSRIKKVMPYNIGALTRRRVVRPKSV